MIHPQYWSLDSTYTVIKNGFHPVLDSLAEQKIHLSFLEPEGKTILDLGASTGISAEFYLKHGAKKIIAVEIDEKRASRIKEDDRIEVITEPASWKHLERSDWDCCKIDIEGYEMELLPYLICETRPVILEAHTWYNNSEFRKIGYRFLTSPSSMRGNCLMGRK